MPEAPSRSWHVVWLSMIICWGLWLVTFFIAVTLLQAVLQIHVVAQVAADVKKGYFSFSKEFVQTVPLDVLPVSEQQKIDEMLVRYYLEMRYTRIPDQIEMQRRWGARLAFLSTYDVYRKSRLDPEQVDVQQPRVIDIRALELKKDKEHLYDALIDIYEFDGTRSWIKTTKGLNISFTYSSSRVLLGREFSNPHGLVITGVDERKAK